MGGNPRVKKTERARTDLAEIAAFYGEESLNLELRFLSAAEQAFNQIANTPEIGATRYYFHPRLQSLRMWRIPEFPKILLFYRPIAYGIEVVRILHTSRDIESLFFTSEQ